jgi:hypothetical protein
MTEDRQKKAATPWPPFSSSTPLSRRLAASAPEKRIPQYRAIHFVQRGGSDGNDAGAILSTEQGLGAHDQASAAGFADRIDRGESGDENDEPPLSAGRLEDARRNWRLADVLIRQAAEGGLTQRRHRARLPNSVPLLPTKNAH